MRLRPISALTLTLLIATTACSSSSDETPSGNSSSDGAKLSAEWTPKLETATKAESTICNQVGDQACAEHLTDIALVVTDLKDAVSEAGGADAYPRTAKEIEKIDDAVDAYTDHECLGDENAGIKGSPCPADAYAIMAGGSVLKLTLELDELKNGG
jgi:hypothetical protein